MKLPGMRLLAIARLALETDIVARVLEPLVADWQREWLGAATRTRRARIWLAGASCFFVTSASCLVWRDTPPALQRTARDTLLALAAFTVVLDYASWIGMFGATKALWLVPRSIVTSTCFAIFPLAIRLGAEHLHRTAARRHLMHIVMAATMCVFVAMNWVFPVWNRTVREELAPVAIARPLALGGPELMLHELLSGDATRRITLTSFYPPTSRLVPRREVARELHHRTTFVLLPALLAMVGWATARVFSSTRWWTLALWTTLNFVLWVALRGYPPLIPLPPLVSLWSPLLVWTLSSAALMCWSTRIRQTRMIAG